MENQELDFDNRIPLEGLKKDVEAIRHLGLETHRRYGSITGSLTTCTRDLEDLALSTKQYHRLQSYVMMAN